MQSERDSTVVVLDVLVRLSGAAAVRDADAIADTDPAQRPQIVGRAIATHGRSDAFVRAMVKGINLPELLQQEMIKRKDGDHAS